jgi:hypothetical protein
MDSEPDRIFQHVYAIFERLLDQLGASRADLAVQTFDDHRQLGLIPKNPLAAKILAIVPRDYPAKLTLWAGRGTCFEIPFDGSRYTDRPFLDEIKVICEAVISGRISEDVWFKGSRMSKSKGVVDIPPTATVRWRLLFTNPLKSATLNHFTYKPY